jgi:uncharacterized protein YaaW (UPF0174 family)
MKISRLEDSTFHIECDLIEIMILSNSINNLRQEVKEYDYTTLVGATVEEVNDVHQVLIKAQQ